MKIEIKTRGRVWLSSAALLWAACGSDGSPSGELGTHTPWTMDMSAASAMDAAVADAATPVVVVDHPPDAAVPEPACRPIDAQKQPMRAISSGAGGAVISADDLFAHQFKDNCGACHIEGKGSNGMYLPSKVELAANLQSAIDHMKSDELTNANGRRVMPPLGKRLSDRKAPDPVLDLLNLLEAWQAAGTGDFFPDPTSVKTGSDTPLAAGPLLAKSLTNMGSCVPAARIVGSETMQMDTLDAKFAAATGFGDLPAKLSETDLSTLDSEALAKQGVISFAPAYTLWADDAKKMRYVRVPRGKSIVFSPSKQNFDIPDNTRFYKTFLKEVLDADGNVGFKKMETRLIVVRHAVQAQGEPDQIKALFGTYAWNETETEAVLEAAPLRDGTPFADHLIWYLTDEKQAKAFIDDPDNGLSVFVQVRDGASDEEKQLLAKPFLFEKKFARTYGLPGSERCVECHRGGPDGGFILGFSPLQIRRRPTGEGGVIDPATPDELNQLERFISYGLITGVTTDQVERKVLKLEDSQGARSARSDAELTAQGYMLGNCAHCHNPKGYATITAPELLDNLNFYPNAAGGGIFQFPLERYSPRIFRKRGQEVVRLPYITTSVYDVADMDQPALTSEEEKTKNLAPWRSLIYRNVNTAFSYSGDSAIYPHMPLNTPGYDPRVSQIMAKWMLSIPSYPKSFKSPPNLDRTEQPNAELKPSDPNYPMAQQIAQKYFQGYLDGEWSKYVPDTGNIVDARVQPPTVLVPPSEHLGIPGHPHWIPLDLTDPPGGWQPRNGTWFDTLVKKQPSGGPNKQEDLARLVPILDTVHADEAMKRFASEPIPLGLWQDKSGCDFSTQKKVSQLLPSDAPWLNTAKPEAPVYMPSRGEAVFGMICINCHGPKADSRGRQSDSLTLLTGGSTRVANFTTGLFGPVAMPGANLAAEFSKGAMAVSGTTERDWALRYMAWMALGGTERTIPDTILNVVSNTAVVGQAVNRGATVSANMLSVARAACSSIMPEAETYRVPSDPEGNLPPFAGNFSFGRFDPARETTYEYKNLIDPSVNGDAELWRQVCTYENEPPVRTFAYQGKGTAGLESGVSLARLYPRKAYPAGAPVMDQKGKPRPGGLSADNVAPWCVLDGAADLPAGATVADADAYYARLGLVRCPPALTASAPLTAEDQRNWSMRGAVNAGRLVFHYLEELTSGRVKPQLAYNECEKLSAQKP